MAKFIVLVDWTEQGIKNAKESPARVAAATTAFKAKGVTIEQVFWTLGGHDLVVIISAHDGEDVAAALLTLGAAGNVRTKTLRAFEEADFKRILGKMG